MTVTVYEIRDGFATGRSKSVDSTQVLPRNWVIASAPTHGVGEASRYVGDGWQVVPISEVNDIRKSILKGKKLNALEEEGLRRVMLIYPDLDSKSILELEVDRWLSIAPAARQPTTDYSNLISTIQAWRQARINLRALTNLNDINDYDVQTDPSWPVI